MASLYCRSSWVAAAAVMAAAMTHLLCPWVVYGFPDACSSRDQLVYPLGACCEVGREEAAVYYGKEVYELGVPDIFGSIEGGLAPEWDESSSAFYVRSAAVGAKYAFDHLRTREIRHVVAQYESLVIVNSETGRVLGWKEGLGGAKFLVEVEAKSPLAAEFQFARTSFASMARCNFVLPGITCDAYLILQAGMSTVDLGLHPLRVNGVTFFTLSDVSSPSFPPVVSSFQLLSSDASFCRPLASATSDK